MLLSTWKTRLDTKNVCIRINIRFIDHSPLFCIPLWLALLLLYCLRAMFPSMLLLLLQFSLRSLWFLHVHRSSLRVASLLLWYAFHALIYAHSSYCWLAQYSWVGLSKRDGWENCGFGQFGLTTKDSLHIEIDADLEACNKCGSEHTFRCRQCTVMTWFLAPKCPKEP